MTGFQVTDFDTAEGLTINIDKGVLNSFFISYLIKFLGKCHKLDVKVRINTNDGLTKRSLEAVGVTKFAVLD